MNNSIINIPNNNDINYTIIFVTFLSVLVFFFLIIVSIIYFCLSKKFTLIN